MMTMIDGRGLRDISVDVIGPDGRLKVMPASYYEGTTVNERAVFGVRTGNYILPTTELIDWLREFIGDRSAIEIGSGNGVVADALGIPGTDNMMQTWPEIKLLYDGMQQATVPYGPNVIDLPADEAIAKYKPDVVIACWVTHKYDLLRHESGGNMYGVLEDEVVKSCKNYVMVGNDVTHHHKAIWKLPHKKIAPPWVYSRAFNGAPEFIAIWGDHDQSA